MDNHSIETLVSICKKYNLTKDEIIYLSLYYHEKYNVLGFFARFKYENLNIVPITQKNGTYGIPVSLTLAFRSNVQITNDNFDQIFHIETDVNSQSSEKKIPEETILEETVVFDSRDIALLEKILDNQYPESVIIGASEIVKNIEGIGGGIQNFLKKEKASREWMNYCKNNNLAIMEGWAPLLRKFNILNGTDYQGFLLGIKNHIDIYKEKKQNLIDKSAEEMEDKLRDKYSVILERIDAVDQSILKIQILDVPSIDDFKTLIIENEGRIISDSNDQQLFAFLKLSSFLNDFQNQIKTDINTIPRLLKKEDLVEFVKNYDSRDDLVNIVEELSDNVAFLEGKDSRGVKNKLEQLLTLGENMENVLNAHILTLNYYHSMAQAMLIFYLNNKKIQYFEIFEAFEKMGVFDSTWEKNILAKINSIEIRLANIESQLLKLNNNFERLIDASDSILAELKNIDSTIRFNNLLTGIQTYQLYNFSKKTKKFI